MKEREMLLNDEREGGRRGRRESQKTHVRER